MKHFIKDGDVLAFEDDGSQDHLVPEGATAIDKDTAKAGAAAVGLDQALAMKIAEIDAACAMHINTEFTSMAKGSTHSYDCGGHDQDNIALAISGLLGRPDTETADYRPSHRALGLLSWPTLWRSYKQFASTCRHTCGRTAT